MLQYNAKMLWYPFWALQPFLPGSYIISLWYYDHRWRQDRQGLIHITQIKIPMAILRIGYRLHSSKNLGRCGTAKIFIFVVLTKTSSNDDGCACTFSSEHSGPSNLVGRSKANNNPWPLIMFLVSVYLKSKCDVANCFASQSSTQIERLMRISIWFLRVLMKTQTEPWCHIIDHSKMLPQHILESSLCKYQ